MKNVSRYLTVALLFAAALSFASEASASYYITFDNRTGKEVLYALACSLGGGNRRTVTGWYRIPAHTSKEVYMETGSSPGDTIEWYAMSPKAGAEWRGNVRENRQYVVADGKLEYATYYDDNANKQDHIPSDLRNPRKVAFYESPVNRGRITLSVTSSK
ncbi:MAG: hypothetical protein Q4F74_06140 [Synergistaceae bacterium]|nr:hypothetical protein [Synergistaceae bacterium]